MRHPAPPRRFPNLQNKPNVTAGQTKKDVAPGSALALLRRAEYTARRGGRGVELMQIKDAGGVIRSLRAR